MQNKKIISVIAGVVLAVGISGCGSSNTDKNTTKANETKVQETTTEGKEIFGDFNAEDLNGKKVSKEVFSNKKLTMVNIWATFCTPCINEMPDLGQLSEEYKDKDFQIIGMPVDIVDRNGVVDPSQFKQVFDIVNQTNANYMHIVPSASLLSGKLGEVVSVPETVFVDSSGKQVGRNYIGSKSKSEWELIINDLLSQIK